MGDEKYWLGVAESVTPCVKKHKIFPKVCGFPSHQFTIVPTSDHHTRTHKEEDKNH